MSVLNLLPLGKARHYCALLLGLLLADSALAVTYTIRNNQNNNPPCSGTWSRSGSVHTCTGRVTLAAGDILTATSDVTIRANGGFSLSSNTIGNSTNTIALVSDFGDITAVGSGNTFSASITSGSGAVNLSNSVLTGSITTTSAAITLGSTTVSGGVTGGGTASFTNSSINGDTSTSGNITSSGTSFGGDLTVTGGTANLTGGSVGGDLLVSSSITTNGTSVSGTLTASNGSISLTGSTITGLVRSGCCTVTTNNTNLQGGARSDSSSLSITGGTIAGTFYAGNNPAIFTGVTMTSGSVSGASTVTFTDSFLGSAESKVTVTSVSGEVTLNNTTAFGDFTAPNYSSIRVNSPSTVSGTCLPNSTPANACNASVAPVCFTDNFNRTSLGADDWAVTSRRGSFGVPRIVNNRLRLTDNSAEVATAATLQRLLPANANYVQVQFTFNAYGGNGADGVAVVFSDASVTPQPGAFGGPLGYGTKGTADTTGFAGGWLGVGIDEYGNFSNEGGPNSVGQRPDSVAVRGSGAGTSGYRYLAGTAANLSPGIDIAGSSPGPGHIYRITLDSTVVGRTMVRLERKVGTGNFTTLISSFDVRNSAGQAAIPNDFYLSLTGSTGGSNNIHELDDLQICATRMNPIGAQIDHIRVEHDGSALTCQPETVTVKACMDANCTSTYPDPVTVTLSPVAGWVGGNSLALTGGVGTGQYRRTTLGDVTFGVTGVSAPLKPFSTPKCANGGALNSCPLSFYESGFIFDVSNMVANTVQTVSLQAVRASDTSQLCVPAFESGTRAIKFWSTYVNPNSGTRSVAIDGNAISGAAPGTDINLTFGPQARASFTVRYPDAGQMTLNARYAPTSGDEANLVMTGTDSFIARPVGLCVYSDTANSDCVAGNASCSKFVAAGDPFRLRVGGVAWQDNDTDGLCSGNLTTPNYRQSSIVLSHSLVAPGGGSLGSLGVAGVDIAAADGGEKVLTNQSITEVGVFTITATPPTSYLNGPGVGNSDGSVDNSREVVSTSANIGRFYPASFLFADPNVSPVCNGFTYAGLVGKVGPPLQLAKAGQPFSASGELSARNRAGGVTTNYVDDFVKLAGSGLVYADSDAEGVISTGNSSVSEDGAAGKRGYLDYATANLAYSFNELREPYKMATQISATDSDGVTGSVVDQVIDEATGNPDENLLPDFRLGQARIDNAHGSELQDLSLPFTAAYFNGSGYAPNLLDSCTVFKPASLGAYQRTGGGSGTPVLENLPYQLLAGDGSYLLRAPGQDSSGSALLTYDGAPSWLQYDWNGDGVLDKPSGLATFGIYKGAAPLIFRRELYR